MQFLGSVETKTALIKD